MAEKTVATSRLKGDGIIWAVFFTLCLISIIEVFSASSNLTYKTSNYWGPVIKHTLLLGVGVIFMIATMNIKCKYFKLVTPFALLISFISLLICLFIGHATNGAARWINLGIIQFQPSELAKGSVVLAVAQILSAMQTEHGAEKRAFKYILILSGVFLAFIVTENLSTAFLLGSVVILMMWIGRVPKRLIGNLLGCILISGLLCIAAIMLFGTDQKELERNDSKLAMTEKVIDSQQSTGKKEEKSVFGKVLHRMDTWKGRINEFFNNEPVPPEKFDLDTKAQVGYSNIAIASSNMVGKGPGNSTARDYLPQAFSDFIYSIIIEEMGVEGAAIVCFLYIILLFRTASIASRCVNTFPALLVMGMALLLVTQAMFNMMVAVGLAPVTGQPLPLISKGGTSSIMNCVYIGVILSVSYSAKKKDDMSVGKKQQQTAIVPA